MPKAEDIDDTPLTFGKYKGLTPYEISAEDPGYLCWLYDNVRPLRCSRELRDASEQDVRELEDGIYGNTFGWSGDFN